LVKRLRTTLPLMMLLGLLISPGGATAAGIGVSPGSLEIETYPLVKATGSIVVVNTSAEAGEYQLYTESKGLGWLSIDPVEFTLEANQSQTVEITVSPPLTATGEHEVEVCVVSLTPGSEIKVGCGVKVPLKITVLPPSPTGLIAGFTTGSPLFWIVIAIVAAVVIPLAVRRRRKARAV
jgi:hypothetical protein